MYARQCYALGTCRCGSPSDALSSTSADSNPPTETSSNERACYQRRPFDLACNVCTSMFSVRNPTRKEGKHQRDHTPSAPIRKTLAAKASNNRHEGGCRRTPHQTGHRAILEPISKPHKHHSTDWSAALFNHTRITKLGRKSRLDCPLLVQHSCTISHHAHHKEHSKQNNALPGHSNVLSQPPPTPTPRQRQPKPKPPPFRILSSIVLDFVLANKTNANRSKPAVRAALKGGTDLCRSYIVIGYNFSGASRTRGRVMKRSRGLHSRSPPWRKRCRRPSG